METLKCLVGNLEKQAADTDRMGTLLMVPTYNEGHSLGAFEPGQENGISPMLLPDAISIIKNEDISSD